MTALLRYCWYYILGYRKRIDVKVAGREGSITVPGPVWVKQNRKGLHFVYEEEK